MAAIELLDLEQASLGWTPTHWQRELFPAEYRDEFLVLHDGVDTRRFARSPWHAAGDRPAVDRRPGRFPTKRESSASSPDRSTASAGSTGSWRSPTPCFGPGPTFCASSWATRSSGAGWTSTSTTGITPLTCWRSSRRPIPIGSGSWAPSTPRRVAEVLAASDLHVAPGRPYPVARSLLEAMAAGCVVLASDTEPHREVIAPGETGLLVDGRRRRRRWRGRRWPCSTTRPPIDRWAMPRRRWCASSMRQDVCLPRLAERFTALAAAGGRRP